jgi:hypothetical protein
MTRIDFPDFDTLAAMVAMEFGHTKIGEVLMLSVYDNDEDD